MRTILAGAMLAALAMPAAAETRHDVKLEQAVMEIVASKMGDIRGTISYRRKLETVLLPGILHRGPTVPTTSEGDVELSRGDLPMDGGRVVPRVVATF